MGSRWLCHARPWPPGAALGRTASAPRRRLTSGHPCRCRNLPPSPPCSARRTRQRPCPRTRPRRSRSRWFRNMPGGHLRMTAPPCSPTRMAGPRRRRGRHSLPLHAKLARHLSRLRRSSRRRAPAGRRVRRHRHQPVLHRLARHWPRTIPVSQSRRSSGQSRRARRPRRQTSRSFWTLCRKLPHRWPTTASVGQCRQGFWHPRRDFPTPPRRVRLRQPPAQLLPRWRARRPRLRHLPPSLARLWRPYTQPRTAAAG